MAMDGERLSGNAASQTTEAAAEAVLAALAALPWAERLAALADTRPVHRALFADSAPDHAGIWRGTPGTTLAETRRVVHVLRRGPGLRPCDPCAPPEAVAGGMARFAARVRSLAGDARGDPHDAIAAIAADFLAIHPYADGNGRVLRLILRPLAGMVGLAASPDWTVGRRPYDTTMSLCLQLYPQHSALLSAYLRRWFERRDDGEAGGHGDVPWGQPLFHEGPPGPVASRRMAAVPRQHVRADRAPRGGEGPCGFTEA
jgi:fido (protein-threonine AMPylation protein)